MPKKREWWSTGTAGADGEFVPSTYVSDAEGRKGARVVSSGIVEFPDSARWRLLAPMRWYFRHFPVQKGKGIIKHLLVDPLLSHGVGEFTYTLPAGGMVNLCYREAIGSHVLLYGGFETPEIESVLGFVQRGTWAIDLGANIGLFTVALAQAVGSSGGVLACEPVPVTVERLRANVKLNGLDGVVAVRDVAAWDSSGEIEMICTEDSAYASAQEGWTASALSRCRVLTNTVDAMWADLGSPNVSVVKIDVEGAERHALLGGHDIISRCRPAILIEIGHSNLQWVTSFLEERGYTRRQPDGFERSNYLFLPN